MYKKNDFGKLINTKKLGIFESTKKNLIHIIRPYTNYKLSTTLSTLQINFDKNSELYKITIKK